jgi:hypothetical protein
MKMPPKVFFAFVLAMVCLFSFLIGRCSKDVDHGQDISHGIDTVYVERIKLVEVQKLVLPSKVVIQQKVDSILRKQKERETIVIGQKLSRQKDSRYLSIQTIDTTGKIVMNEYGLLDGDLYAMDNKGNVEIDKENRKKLQRKAKRRKVWQVVKTVGAVSIGIIIGNQLAK